MSNDTPSLITWITEDADRMHLAGKLASISELSDPANFQWLVKMCGKVGFSVNDMQNRIRPVARALGLYGARQDKNYYQLLGVNQDATEKEIRTAYRTRIRRIHPDTRDDHEMDKEAFVALTTAYKTLSSPILRHKYNQEILADGIWNEGSKSQKKLYKKRRKSKVKLVLLFGLVFLILAGIILFSDVFFNMSAMQDIDKQLFGGNRKANGNSENTIASTQSIRPVDSASPSSQSKQNNVGELEERSDGTHAASKSGAVAGKQKARNSKQTVEPGKEALKSKKQNTVEPDNKVDAKKESQESGAKVAQGVSNEAPDRNGQPKENKRANGISDSAFDGHENTLTKRSGTTVKPLDKKRQARLQSEVKVLDLIKDPPTRNKLQSFLNRYTSAYQSRNENQFFNFFTPDAKENEQPLNRLFPVYRQTFKDFENIDYRIHLKEYLVDLNDTSIKIKGEYYLDWDSRQDGVHHSIKGDLSMSLVMDNDISYKIKRLNY